MPSRNQDVIRGMYERLMGPGRMEDAATAELVPSFFGADVEVCQMDGMLGTAGVFHGHQGVVQVTVEVLSDFADPVFVPEELRDVGDRVAAVVRFRARGRRSGAPVEFRAGHLFTLRRGLIERFEVFDDPADVLDAVVSG